MSGEPIPRATVEELARQVRELMLLKGRQMALMGEMIRWCVQELRRDPNGRPAGQSHLDAMHTRKLNAENKKKALLYLEHLATKMEDAGHEKPLEPTQGAERKEPIS